MTTSFQYSSKLIVLFTLVCFSSGQLSPPFACDLATKPWLRNFTFCDTTLSEEARVAALLDSLTLEDKIGWLSNEAPEIPRLGIPSYQWWNEAIHGISNYGKGTTFSGMVPGATSFPQVILIAATFNESLYEIIGKAISTEARAMYNVGLGGLTFWSPNVNIFRDPRWGRGQENPGEDPVLSSKYGVAFVRGLEHRDDGDRYRLKVSACCKHYTAADLENWKGIDSYNFDAVVTEQDLRDTFQPPFESCVVDAKISCVMCSHHKVNGKATCGDPDMLDGVIRGQWKHYGYIVSDCEALNTMYYSQHFTRTPEETAALVLNSGLDLDCGSFLRTYTQAALNRDLVTQLQINRALSKTFLTMMRLGFFDGHPGNNFYGNLGPKDVCTLENQELAREAARQGIVLLKNVNGSLPLSPAAIKSLAVIGPHANATLAMLGTYAGIPCNYTTPLQGLSATVGTVFHRGCSDISCLVAEVDAAKTIASLADAVVLVMGSDYTIEGENQDRVNITLPGQQQLLVSEVATASIGPVILVILSGGGMDIQFAKDNPKITSILWGGFPGEAGGAALADVIFGFHNPGGRLPMTWYPQSYVEKVKMTEMNMRADPATGYPGRTYRFYRGPKVYSFGEGLSYSEFSHSLVHAPTFVSMPLDEGHFCLSSRCESVETIDHTCQNLVLDVHLNVKNLGKMTGTETVLLFSSPPEVHNAPHKHLLGFEKLHLAPGEEGVAKFTVEVCKDLGIVDEVGRKKVALGQYYLHVGSLTHSLEVRI